MDRRADERTRALRQGRGTRRLRAQATVHVHKPRSVERVCGTCPLTACASRALRRKTTVFPPFPKVVRLHVARERLRGEPRAHAGNRGNAATPIRSDAVSCDQRLNGRIDAQKAQFLRPLIQTIRGDVKRGYRHALAGRQVRRAWLDQERKRPDARKFRLNSGQERMSPFFPRALPARELRHRKMIGVHRTSSRRGSRAASARSVLRRLLLGPPRAEFG